MPVEMTDKQKRFVAEYVSCANATQAAKNAGYSMVTAHEQGRQLLGKPHIARAVLDHLPGPRRALARSGCER